MIYAHFYRKKLCFACTVDPSRSNMKKGINFFMPTGIRSKIFKFIWKCQFVVGFFKMVKVYDEKLESKLKSISSILHEKGFTTRDILFLFPMDETSKRIYFQTRENGIKLFWKAVFDEDNQKRLFSEFDALQSLTNMSDISFTVSEPRHFITQGNICLSAFVYKDINSKVELSGNQERILVKSFTSFNQIETEQIDIKNSSWWDDSFQEYIPQEIQLNEIETGWAHGDLSAQNVAYNDNDLHVIDWEDFTKDAPIYTDVVRYFTSVEKQRLRGAVRASVVGNLIKHTKVSIKDLCAISIFLISKSSPNKVNLIGFYLNNCIKAYIIEKGKTS